MWRASHKLSARVCGGRLPPSRFSSGQPKKDGATSAAEAAAKPAPAAQAKPAAAPTQQAASTPPPPPPPSSGGGGWFFKLLGLTVVGTAGTVGYAWYDPKFRSQIEANVPYSKDALDVVFSYIDSIAGKKESVTTGPIVSPKEQIEERGLAKTIRPKVDEPKVKKSTKELEAEAKESARKAVEEKKKKEADLVKQRVLEKEAEEAAENAALENILTVTVKEVMEATLQAIDAHKEAAQATRSHTKLLKKAMDDADTANKEVEWSSVTGAHSAKKTATDAANMLKEKAEQEVEKLKMAIKDGRDSAVTKKNKILISAEESLNKAKYDLNSAIAGLEKAISEANLMKEYRDLVKKGKEQFKQELESIMPDVKIGKRLGGKMTEDELNSLIAHAHRRIEQLQRQLAEQQALEQQRMQESLSRQQQEDERIGDTRVKLEQERLRADFDVEKQKLEAESSVKFERELRHQLARQAAAHSDHLAEVLKVQERELHVRYEALLHDRTIDERDHLRGEIKHWIARMEGIEAAIEGRAELEKQARKAQELWLACQSLQRIIALGREGVDEDAPLEEHLKPLANELMAIKEAGNNHPFVNSIIASIPDDAINHGVWTADALYDRFQKVRRLCKRVAMIDETGGTLFRYFLSLMQSFLVFSASKPIPDSEEVDPNDLNTFTILDNAAHHLEKGDLEQTLRFLNQLKGESRKVASDWIKDTRLLLETRQAADALLAHASASGLGSLFEIK